VYYRLLLKESNGKESFSKNIVLYPNSNSAIWLYPNPAKEMLHIHSAKELECIEVYSTVGNRMYSKNIVYDNSSKAYEVNTSFLNSGTYVLKVIFITGDQMALKFIKE